MERPFDEPAEGGAVFGGGRGEPVDEPREVVAVDDAWAVGRLVDEPDGAVGVDERHDGIEQPMALVCREVPAFGASPRQGVDKTRAVGSPRVGGDPGPR